MLFSGLDGLDTRFLTVAKCGIETRLEGLFLWRYNVAPQSNSHQKYTSVPTKKSEETDIFVKERENEIQSAKVARTANDRTLRARERGGLRHTITERKFKRRKRTSFAEIRERLNREIEHHGVVKGWAYQGGRCLMVEQNRKSRRALQRKI